MTRAIWGTIFLLLAPVSLPAPERTVDDFFQAFTDEWMRFATDFAASTRYFSGPEQDGYERQIGRNTPERRAARYRLLRRGLKELLSFDRKRMTEGQRLAAEVLAWDLENRVLSERYDDYSFPLVQNYGAQAALPQLLTVMHTVVTARDAENYVARLGHLAPRMDEAILEARRLIGRKLLPPKFILQAAIGQIRAFVGMPAGQNPLVATFAGRMKKVSGLSGTRQEELRAEAEKVTLEQVYPAWGKAMAVLESALPQATDDAGLWRFPKGMEVYNFALRRYTTTKMTGEEVHQTGLRMVDEIEKRMDVLLREAGQTEGTVSARMVKLREEQPKFPDTEQGMAEYKADIERTIREAERRAALLFDRVPKSAVVAQPYPDFVGQRAASYFQPSRDGSRPGTFQYTLRTGRERFSHSTIYHETVPGHHFQLALQLEDANLPRFRQNGIFGGSAAVAEGWGLYAERLAAEFGWYEGDRWGQLDQLAQALFRAQRLVVDTGLHIKRWTRQQAVDYIGRPDEVDRYVVNPGQACAYMIGELKIVELRERARRELGERFSLKEFHTVVLGTGVAPLDILEQQVDRYIRGKKGQS